MSHARQTTTDMTTSQTPTPPVLNPDIFAGYVTAFNGYDPEGHADFIDNPSALPWMVENIPYFECPDKDIEEIYYFRWWTYRKHIRKTPAGFVVTEFLPDVHWADRYNTTCMAASHQIREGRWLHDPAYMNDFSRFWFGGGGSPHMYSAWLADCLYSRYLVNGDHSFVVSFLDALVRNFREWESGWTPTHTMGWQDGKGRLAANGLFWQIDSGCDGMEFSIGGGGHRPTINSYMYGDALATARIAAMAGDEATARAFEARAREIKVNVQRLLWDKEAGFFKTLCEENGIRYDLDKWYSSLRENSPHYQPGQLVDVREEIGFVPWCFNLPDPGFESAWSQLMDPQGFHAPYGPTSAEQRHPKFRYRVNHACLWNGPSWPFATTQTLVAMANLLNDYDQTVVGKREYLETLRIYTRSHRLKRADGAVIPWIDEDLDPYTGAWLARDFLYAANAPDKDRGRDYNHSGYCDLVISGLVGLRPRADGVVEVNPLVPDGTWDHFCLDNVLYHGHLVTILYDRSGRKYGRGAGLRIIVDGAEAARRRDIGRLQAGLS